MIAPGSDCRAFFLCPEMDAGRAQKTGEKSVLKPAKVKG